MFGADDIHYPEGITIYRMLDEMNEEQLLALNDKLCKKYEHELVQDRLKSINHLVTDTGEGSHRKRRGLVYG